MRRRCSRARRALIVATLVVGWGLGVEVCAQSAHAAPSAESFKALLDLRHGGVRGEQRSLTLAPGELAILLARRGDREARTWVEVTLREALALEDQKDGGFFANSLDSTWHSPRHERTLNGQATAIRLYALGFFLFNDQRLLETAHNTQKFVEEFLKIGDGRYALSEKSKKTGQMATLDQDFSRSAHAAYVEALTILYAASGQDEYVSQALRISEVSLAGADETSSLAELLAVADAYLSLYSVTAEGRWLERAQKVFEVARKRNDDPALRVHYVRTALHLAGYTGDDALKMKASSVLSSYVLPENASPALLSLYLLAHAEAASTAAHLMTIGEKDNPQAQKLWRETLNVMPLHLQREWMERQNDLWVKKALSYPRVAKPAVFVCSHSGCSLPLFTEEEVRETIAKVVP